MNGIIANLEGVLYSVVQLATALMELFGVCVLISLIHWEIENERKALEREDNK